MKQFKNISLTLFIFLSFFNSNIRAQQIQTITPLTAHASALEVKRIFGARINVSAEEIKNFYLQQWEVQSYNYNCKKPKVSKIEINHNYAKFKWSGPFISSSFNDRYSVSYLHLRTGESETITTNSNEITIPVQSDLFLFVFQTNCGNTASALDIVIIEKPIFFLFQNQNLLNSQNCACPSANLIWETQASLTNPDFVSHLWGSTNDSTEKYYCEVLLTNGLSASFTANIQFEEEGPGDVYLTPSCMTNVGFNEDKTYISMHEAGAPENTIGVFGFSSNNNSNISGNGSEAPQFSFNLASDSPHELDKIFLYKCANTLRNENTNKKRNKAPKEINLKSLSNPFKDYSKIEYNLPEQESISIVLFNAYGKQLRILKNKRLTEAGTYQLGFDLTDLPDGIYFCVLKTPNKTLPLKLLKIQ